MQWRKQPIVFEIPTWAWLSELSARYRAQLTLGTVPPEEWDALAARYFDAVWFMGVWERSPDGVRISNADENLQEEFRRAVPDYSIQDNVGSAYCVRAYQVDEHLGGAEGLAHAREQLARRGIGLVLDYVPNHVAPDHVWVAEHPEYFIQGTRDDLARMPHEFLAVGENVFAHGRDPYFPPWRDVVQVNAFNADFRTASVETVNAIAAQCDGIRCDMAMLLLNDIFEKTWGARSGGRPDTEFWSELIPAVKENFNQLIFLAEAYWDTEYALIANGFDYCYDKRLYDRLARDNAESVRLHLAASVEVQEHLARFVENHDEARAATVFAPPQARAAAVVISTLPGMKLFHDGQFEGRKIHLPVFLARRAAENKNYDLESFYRALLKTLDADLFHRGAWHFCACSGWSDNTTFQNILAWTWRRENERALIVVNDSARRSQAMIEMAWDDLPGRVWRLHDPLNGDLFLRDGNQLCDAGLFVDLDAWRYHFLRFE